MVGAFLLSLAAGAIASTLQAIRATVAETKAESRKRDADEASKQAEKGRDELASLNEDLRAPITWRRSAWPSRHGATTDQMDQVRQHLQMAESRRPGDPDLRGFEWYYLRRLFDASTRMLRGHTGMITGVAFSPDGRRVVTAGMADATFKAWDVGSGQLIWSAGHSDQVICVAYRPDGRTIASGCSVLRERADVSLVRPPRIASILVGVRLVNRVCNNDVTVFRWRSSALPASVRGKADERSDPHPLGDRTGRSQGGGAALAVDL